MIETTSHEFILIIFSRQAAVHPGVTCPTLFMLSVVLVLYNRGTETEQAPRPNAGRIKQKKHPKIRFRKKLV